MYPFQRLAVYAIGLRRKECCERKTNKRCNEQAFLYYRERDGGSLGCEHLGPLSRRRRVFRTHDLQEKREEEQRAFRLLRRPYSANREFWRSSGKDAKLPSLVATRCAIRAELLPIPAVRSVAKFADDRAGTGYDAGLGP